MMSWIYSLVPYEFKKGGSSGGHNGLGRYLFGPEFYRFRIGIGHPRNDEKTRNIDVSSWVLGTPFADDLSKIKDVSSKTVLALESFIEEGLTVAQKISFLMPLFQV